MYRTLRLARYAASFAISALSALALLGKVVREAGIKAQ
jgi:hypothetical protein